MSGDTETRASLHAGPGTWIVLAPELVPDEWRHRSVPLAGVWLAPGEVAAAAAGGARPVDQSDHDLVPLLLRGLAHDDMARALNVSVRTLQRRLARLRARYGARSQHELVTILARRTATPAGATASRVSEDHGTAAAKCSSPPRPRGTKEAHR